jgi:membrane protease YdiL (CAAX protease family)
MPTDGLNTQEMQPDSFPPKRPPWSFFEAVVLLLAFALLHLAFSSLGSLLRPDGSLLGVQLGAANICFLGLAWLFLRLRTGPPHVARAAIGLVKRHTTPQTLKAAVEPLITGGAVYLLWWLAYAFWMESQKLSPPPQPVVRWIFSKLDENAVAEVIAVTSVAVLLVPLAEEIMFRGFLYLSIRPWLGPVPAAVVGSLAFSVLHFYPSGVGHLFILAFIFTWLTEVTETLWTSVIVHALHNGMMIMLLLILHRHMPPA